MVWRAGASQKRAASCHSESGLDLRSSVSRLKRDTLVVVYLGLKKKHILKTNAVKKVKGRKVSNVSNLMGKKKGRAFVP